MIELLQQMPQDLDIFIADEYQALTPEKARIVYVEYENYDEDSMDDCWYDSVKDALDEGIEFEDLIKCVVLFK